MQSKCNEMTGARYLLCRFKETLEGFKNNNLRLKSESTEITIYLRKILTQDEFNVFYNYWIHIQIKYDELTHSALIELIDNVMQRFKKDKES